MPPVVAAVGLFVGSVVVTAAVTGWTILWGGVLVNATLLAILTAGAYYGRPKPTRPTIDLGARSVSIPSDAPPRRVIYGKAKVGPQFIAHSEAGSASVFIYAICEHDFERIDAIYFRDGKFLNDAEIATLNADGYIGINSWSSSDGEDLGDLRKRYGDANDRLVKNSVQIWLARPGGLQSVLNHPSMPTLEIDTAGMEGVSTSFIVVSYPSPSRISQVRTGEKTLPIGAPPPLTIDIDRGDRDIADLPASYLPITQGGTDYSQDPYNAARMLYDYVSKYTDYGESLFQQDRIDYASFVSAIRECGVSDLEAHGQITLIDSVDGVLAQFEMALNGGWITDIGGILNVRANGQQAPVRTITADHVLPGWTVVPQTPRENRYSDFTIEFVNEDLEIDTLSYHKQEARDEFGERSQEIQTALVKGADQAYRLAATLSERSFHSTQVSLIMNASGLLVKPGEVVTLDLPELLLDHERQFLVVSAARQPNLTVELGLAEYTPPPILPQRVAVEDGIGLANGTATMDVDAEVPTGMLEGTRPGAPVTQDVVLWQASFTAGENRFYRSEKGYSDGNDSYVHSSNNPIFGSLDSGSLSIPAGTIPGITADRTFSFFTTDDNANDAARNRVDVIMGWQPDDESDDRNDIADDVRLVLEKAGVVVVNVAISSASIQFNNRVRERFIWYNLPLLNGQTALASGDAFTVKIVQEQTTGADPQDGLAWSEVRLVTPISTATYWESTFRVGQGSGGDRGWSAGTDSDAYGEHTGTNLTIAGGTIPGISDQRVVSLAGTGTWTNGSEVALELGWEPDEEADDSPNIPDDVYFSLFRNNVELGRGVIRSWNNPDSVIPDSTNSFERFLMRSWDGSAITRPNIGDIITARIWRPPVPNYNLDPDVILRFDGLLTSGGIADDLRLAVIDEDRTQEGTDGLILDMAVEAPQVSVNTSASTTTITLDAGFQSRLLDGSDQQSVSDGNNFRAVLYRASGPLSVELLKG